MHTENKKELALEIIRRAYFTNAEQMVSRL